MAQPYFHDNRHRRTTTTTMPMNNSMINENYEHELMKIMDRERRFSHVQVEEIDGSSMNCFVFLATIRQSANEFVCSNNE